MDTEFTESFYETKEYKAYCLVVAGVVRMAEKQGLEATYRFITEQAGNDKGYLIDAVKTCKAEGWIFEKGSAVRAVFHIGNKLFKIKATERYGNYPAVPRDTKYANYL